MKQLGPLDVVDVFAYTVVLGLFVQFFPAVITESFLITLLSAVLLKVVLEVVVWAKTRLLQRLRPGQPGPRRAVSAAMLLLVLPGSKFLVLELTAVVFRGSVHLGGFFLVTALIVVLMLARAGTRRFLEPRPGPGTAAGTAG
ncbi:hypothetical protein H9639_14170 [Arthrobacter sp. Sa2CUA1]|uniref:Uncharacterized protein n=1 Tax=Arthrobacter gallicola TaxID=2762225 RepID=A0ABR8UV64_9MICC|nr:hypothetical protein [Arthrobacter gallicola]MBD7996444.1 hypothetical protein [Arthrobacter gallicola]